MSRVTIHQPEHLPWLGLFYKIMQADRLVLLDCVQFRKNYFGNRNLILGPNGPFYITVPVSLKGHTQKQYRDIQIAEDGKWQRKYLRSVEQCYGRHPYFEDYFPQLRNAIEAGYRHLAQLNEHLIRLIMSAFGIDTPVVRASELEVQGTSTELLVGLCRSQEATAYLAGAMGKSYMDESQFAEHGISLQHTDFQHPVYPQAGAGEFWSRLSAIDILMNCGPESRAYLETSGSGALSRP